MNDLELRYWNTYGHLDLEPGEQLDASILSSSDLFTIDEIKKLIELGLVVEDSQESA